MLERSAMTWSTRTLVALTDVWLGSSCVDIDISDASVEIGRTALAWIKTIQYDCTVRNVAGGLEGGKLDGICSSVSTLGCVQLRFSIEEGYLR